MQRMFSGVQVDLGGVTLGGVDDNGVGWHIAKLDGWYAPATRTQISQREADHGAWMGPVYLGERPITLTGVIDAPNSATLEDAVEQLLAACALTDTTLTVWETIPKQVTVRRSGDPVIDRLGAAAASYSLLVTAEDPRRYEMTWQSRTTALPSTSGGLVLPATVPLTISATTVSGQINATNAGTIATRPIFTIAGPVQQPQVSVLTEDGTVRTLIYADTLNTGDVLTINTDAHTVLLGTASRRRYLSGQWPEIPAGQSVTIAFTAAAYDPSASLTAQWRSAWL